MNNKFFVYGTLQEGCSNHQVILPEAIESIEPAIIEGMDLYMFRGANFPCMVYGNGQVKGQVITIKKKYLNRVVAMMDRLESYYGPDNPNNLYHRVKDHCLTSEGLKVEVNVYLFNDSRRGLGEPIVSGDFKKYINNNLEVI